MNATTEIQVQKLKIAFTQDENKNEFTINIVNGAGFSAKYVRKAIQKGINSVCELGGKKVGISFGKRFKVSSEFLGFELSQSTFFYNKSERQKNNFNRELKKLLFVVVMDAKDIMQENNLKKAV